MPTIIGRRSQRNQSPKNSQPNITLSTLESHKHRNKRGHQYFFPRVKTVEKEQEPKKPKVICSIGQCEIKFGRFDNTGVGEENIIRQHSLRVVGQNMRECREGSEKKGLLRFGFDFYL